jgi:hypothetical protein
MKIAVSPTGGVNARLPRAALVILLAAVVSLCAIGGSDGAKSIPNLAIQLVAPAGGTVVPRYGSSPVFAWRINARGLPTPKGSGRLEVSTTRSFAQEAIYRFDCGYSPGDCVPHFQWPNTTPHWYDMANSCSDVPPVGLCNGLSTTLYWRVRFQPVGGRSYTSPIGILQRSTPTDVTPPTAQAQPGTSAYGDPAQMLFWASDRSNVVRYVVELYNGDGKVVDGARTDWRTIAGNYYTYVDLPLPTTVGPGAYKFCVTVLDQSDNSATDCAPYTIT